MKRFLKISVSLFLVLLLFTGCGNMANTPTKKVEEFLGKYQSMDSEVLAQLDKAVSTDASMSDEQKKSYRALMEKQYQNLSYKIKDENVTGDTATVDVEIEVLDYATSISTSKKYYEEHKDEFDDKKNDNDNDNDNSNIVEDAKDTVEDAAEGVKDAVEETASYIDYKIKELENVTDKVKYTITFHLEKDKNNEWKVLDITDVDRQKLHGLYG